MCGEGPDVFDYLERSFTVLSQSKPKPTQKGKYLPRKTRLYIKANFIIECNIVHLSTIFT